MPCQHHLEICYKTYMPWSYDDVPVSSTSGTPENGWWLLLTRDEIWEPETCQSLPMFSYPRCQLICLYFSAPLGIMAVLHLAGIVDLGNHHFLPYALDTLFLLVLFLMLPTQPVFRFSSNSRSLLFHNTSPNRYNRDLCFWRTVAHKTPKSYISLYLLTVR